MSKTPKSPAASDADGERQVGGKLGLLVALLRRPQGADISDMMEATGWQQHSVRGALAGALKKHRSFNIVSEKTDGPRVYRIAEPSKDAAVAPAAAPTKSEGKGTKPKPAKSKRAKSAKVVREKADA